MITLLSDFGNQDAYVAVMKGVIAAIAPNETTCDLTHEILPQDILSARFNLRVAYPHFPNGTVHLVVVDPGVGSARRAVAVRCEKDNRQCFLVGPDNGVLSGVIEDFRSEANAGEITAVVLTNARYWRSGVSVESLSATFHGRDIFAPVAAHLACGVDLEALGDRISPDDLVQADLPAFSLYKRNSSLKGINGQLSEFKTKSHYESVQANSAILGVGCIQYVDRFGNLISNIPESVLSDIKWKILLEMPLGSSTFSSIKTYSNAPAGSTAALIGSHGWVEIACNGGSAAAALAKKGGAPVGTVAKLVVVKD